MLRRVLLAILLAILAIGPFGATAFAEPREEPRAAPDGDEPVPPPIAPNDDPAPAPPAPVEPAPAPAPVEPAPAPTEPAPAPAPDETAPAPDETAPAPADAAKADEKKDKPYWRTNVFGRAFRDQKFLFTTWWPAEFKRPSFTLPLVGGVLLATTSNRSDFEGTDMELGDWIRGEATGAAKTTAKRATFFGNAGPGIILIGTGYLIGRMAHNDRLAEASSLSAEALLSTGLYTTVLKNLSARTRPSNGGMGDFFQYSAQNGQVPASFPSGHAAAAFTVAGVFSGVYSDSKWVPWAAYGTATLVGWSRVALHRHFPSDVLVGAVIGNSIGRMAVARNEATRPMLAEIQPYFDPSTHGGGVVWTHTW